MPDATEHYNLQKAGAAGVQNKWALFDGNFDAIERGRTMKRLAGEALAQYDLVYVYPATGKFRKAANGNRPLAGLMVEAASLDTDTYAQTEGPVTNAGWAWTPYQPVYAHASTAGALTQTKTAGLFQPEVGIALSATSIYLFPAGLQITADSFVVVRTRDFVLNAESAVLFSSGSPTRATTEGTNVAEVRLAYARGQNQKAQWKHQAHPAYQGSDLTVRVRWRAASTSGDVTWEVAWAFGADGWAADPSLTVVGTVIDTAKASANQLNEAVITVTTPSHKPAAGETWVIQVRRTDNDMLGDAELVQAIIEYSVDS